MGQASWPKSSRKGIGVYTPTQTLTKEDSVEGKRKSWTNRHTAQGDPPRMEAQEGPTISSSQDRWAIIKQTVMGEKSGSTDYKDEPLPKVKSVFIPFIF